MRCCVYLWLCVRQPRSRRVAARSTPEVRRSRALQRRRACTRRPPCRPCRIPPPLHVPRHKSVHHKRCLSGCWVPHSPPGCPLTLSHGADQADYRHRPGRGCAEGVVVGVVLHTEGGARVQASNGGSPGCRADDSMAILAAFNASAEVEVLGLTTMYGNVPTRMATRNAITLREMAGRRDVPVAEGAHKSLRGAAKERIADFVHGGDGFGNTHPPLAEARRGQWGVAGGLGALRSPPNAQPPPPRAPAHPPAPHPTPAGRPPPRVCSRVHCAPGAGAPRGGCGAGAGGANKRGARPAPRRPPPRPPGARR